MSIKCVEKTILIEILIGIEYAVTMLFIFVLEVFYCNMGKR